MTTLNNRYQILRALGEGGFGKTFLAKDTQMPSRRQVVIKQMKPLSNRPDVFDIIQQRFDREAAVLEAVGKGSSQIPDLYAYFQESGQFYLVQEWIEGKPLSHLAGAPWPAKKVETLLIDVLKALSHIHQQNIIHRDIKPNNIILRTADQRPCLIDFGAVKELMNTVANVDKPLQSSLTIGTPGFMAPEQSAGHPVFASDLYSLAMSAIYLLTGKSPQELPTHSQTGQVLWQQFVPEVSGHLATVLNRATDMTASHRYSSAEDMMAALRSPTTVSTAVPSAPTATATATTRLPTPAKQSFVSSPNSTEFPWKQVTVVAGSVVTVAGLLLVAVPRLVSSSLFDRESVSTSVPQPMEPGEAVAAIATFSRTLEQDEENYEALKGRADAYQAVGEFESAIADYRLARKHNLDNRTLEKMLEQLGKSCAPLTITSYQSRALTSPDGNTQVHAAGDLRRTVNLDHPVNSTESCTYGKRKTVRSDLVVSRKGKTFQLADERAGEGVYNVLQPVSFSTEGRYLVAEAYDVRALVVSPKTNVVIFDLEMRSQVDISNRCPKEASDRYLGFVSGTAIFIDCGYYGYYGLDRKQEDEPPFISIDVASGVGTPALEYSTPIRNYGTRSGEFLFTQEPANMEQP